MGNCLASQPAGSVKQRRGAAAARLKAWRATGIVTLPPGAKEVPPAVWEELGPVVKVLDASGAALTQLPDETSRLNILARLVLPNNQLTALPASLGALSSLRVLILDGNQISELNDEIKWGGLSKLEHLSLCRNRLRCLPPSLGDLASLKILGCRGNDLRSLPQSLGKCINLEQIDASENPRLEKLPADLGHLNKLKELKADGTAVSEVPPALLQGCVALQTLSLHGCPITAERLQETEGFQEFEARRRDKFSKIIAGGLAPARGLDEGVDRQLKTPSR